MRSRMSPFLVRSSKGEPWSAKGRYLRFKGLLGLSLNRLESEFTSFMLADQTLERISQNMLKERLQCTMTVLNSLRQSLQAFQQKYPASGLCSEACRLLDPTGRWLFEDLWRENPYFSKLCIQFLSTLATSNADPNSVWTALCQDDIFGLRPLSDIEEHEIGMAEDDLDSEIFQYCRAMVDIYELKAEQRAIGLRLKNSE